MVGQVRADCLNKGVPQSVTPLALRALDGVLSVKLWTRQEVTSQLEVDSEEGVHDRLEGRIQKTRVAQVPEARGGGGKAVTLPLGGTRQIVQERIVWSRAAPIARVSRGLT